MSFEKKYLKYKTKYLNELQKIKQKGGKSDKPKLIAFTAKWCGHCRNFMPIYNNLKNENSNIEFINYDSEINRDKIEQFKISGFPTLFLEHKNKLIEYEGDRSKTSILEFVNNYSK